MEITENERETLEKWVKKERKIEKIEVYLLPIVILSLLLSAPIILYIINIGLDSPRPIVTEKEKTFYHNVQTGNISDVIFTLDERDFNPNLVDPVTGQTILHAAVYSENLVIVDIILEKTAQYNQNIINTPDKTGVTPLKLAESKPCYTTYGADSSTSDCYKIVAFLRSHGAHN